MWTFLPILKTTIWGGDRIAPFKNIETDESNIGESWEISGVAGSESVVADGPDKGLTLSQLVGKYGADLMGKRNYEKFADSFPLLIKFIDARQDLSVQVHPDDEMAQSLGHKNGKTEMWYVIGADKDSVLALGFKEPVNPADYQDLISSGDIENKLRFIPIRPKEAFFVPAGAVHAICKGAFVAEIQQTSDDTFRLYDYHRKDSNGNERPLHSELAFKALDFNYTGGAPIVCDPEPDVPFSVVKSPYFTTNLLELDHETERDYTDLDSFIIIIATSGKATISCGEDSVILKEGHTVLIPASEKKIIFNPDDRFSCLETFII